MNQFSSVAGEPTLQVMIYHPVNDIWLYLLAAIVLQSLAVYAWRYRQNPAARYMSIGIPCMAVWLLAIVMISISPALAGKIFWVKIEHLCAINVIPASTLFAFHITEQKPAIIKRARAGLLALTAFTWLAVLAGDWHGWMWRGVIWDGVTFGVIRGPLYWGIMAVVYLVLAINLTLYIHRAVKTSGLRRWQALAMPPDMLIMVAGHARWLSTQTDPISPLPLGYMLGGLIWFGIFFGLRVFNLQELAEATVLHDMNDSLIVIDVQDYIVELNPAARKLFGERAPAMIGSRFAAAFFPWPDLAELALGSEQRTGEISLAGGHYLFRVTPMAGWLNRSIGKAIVLQDIGELKRAQALIIDQQKALSIIAERERLGRELHDGRGQVWSYVNMQVEAVRLLLAKNEPAQADTLLQRLESVIRDAHVDIRESIAGLKRGVSVKQGLWQPLEEYFEWFRENTGIDAELVIDKEFTAGALTPTTEVQLLRIIQEALNNVRKHAGARHVKVFVMRRGEAAEFRVEDDGRGFNVEQATMRKDCYGIGIMKERAEEAGARLRIESAPNAGTAVVLSLPLAEEPLGRLSSQ